ncbi:MAG TPA: 3-phosphoshikimate 1-carboxyvinyltransferase [Bacteroidales bacterium]|nr:3-phosphoshikimate 1-carboxyvinyltransferase [Bacteroidales bacterium]
MMNYKIHFDKAEIKGDIFLPFSKSISNRLLIIHAFTNHRFNITNLSESDDTRYMEKAFTEDNDTVDIGHAGTAMRFLTAYFAATCIKRTITGSDRMKNRPIGELVNALNSIGADITYAEKNGFPPLVTSGKELSGETISLKGSISSQYITALLLIAPVLPKGLVVQITDTLISSSYVKLTLDMMKYFGIESSWEGNKITIPHQSYIPKDYTVEADWSGVSYWYQMALLADKTDITLNGLFNNSSQGDAAIAAMFERVGVSTTFLNNKVSIGKRNTKLSSFEGDFVDNPDMVQTFVVALCLKGIPFKITGAQSLRIKETDRIAALQTEMAKLGYTISEPLPGILTWDGKKESAHDNIRIDTYDDHRMALAFAPAALFYDGLIINDATVVTKSYPGYWDDLKSVGAIVQPVD